MDDLIRFIAQQLVDRPGEVQVSRVEGENTTVLELQVGKGEVGKVIGKQGRTAEAMRTILSAVSTKARKAYDFGNHRIDSKYSFRLSARIKFK